MITPVAGVDPQCRAAFTLGCEKTDSGQLKLRFEVKTSSGEWLCSHWFVPSTTDAGQIRWLGRFWNAQEQWYALLREEGLTPNGFFESFNRRISLEDHIKYRTEGHFPGDLAPIDTAYLEWSIAMPRLKAAFKKVMKFDDLCLLEPRVTLPKRYFAHRKGIVWESPVALKEDQWKALIDLEIHERGLIIEEDCIPQENNGARRAIPIDIQREVWRRDQGRCARCGSQERLEFDHIIPFSMGGSSTTRNIQLLCEKCNRAKGGSLA